MITYGGDASILLIATAIGVGVVEREHRFEGHVWRDDVEVEGFELKRDEW